MLARLAENLFWAGRYLERAEDTARLVDVTYHSLLESQTWEVAQAYEVVLDALNLGTEFRSAAGADDEIRAERVVDFLVLDRDNPGSIMSSVTFARENARSAREHISSELWEGVNDLYLSLNSRDLRSELADQPFELFRMLRHRCQTISGTAVETMARDDAWRFFTIGRHLERAEMCCRLINVRYRHLVRLPLAVAATHWVAVLKSVSGLEAFRKHYRVTVEAADVVEFLLLSTAFPRSVLFALEDVEQHLVTLAGDTPSRSVRLLGRTRAALSFRDVDEVLAEGLPEFCDFIQDRVREVAACVADEFFRHTPEGALHSFAAS